MTEALLIVDLQHDFASPDGSMAVEGGMAAAQVMLEWYGWAKHREIPIIMSRDWHPETHSSFKQYGGQWPAHCVQNTRGAMFTIPPSDDVIVITKGTDATADQYSAFHDDLAAILRAKGVQRLYVGGLATDYCVKATVLDALAELFHVSLIREGMRAVEGTGEMAGKEMIKAGATFAMDSAEAQGILDDISYKDYRFILHEERGELWLHIQYDRLDTFTGIDGIGYARPWHISRAQTETGLVKTAFAAVKLVEEHEAMEAFKYRDVRPFDPHMPLAALIRAERTKEAFQQ